MKGKKLYGINQTLVSDVLQCTVVDTPETMMSHSATPETNIIMSQYNIGQTLLD